MERYEGWPLIFVLDGAGEPWPTPNQADRTMPLVSHEMIGHDDERLAIKFSMLDGEQIVQCQISDL